MPVKSAIASLTMTIGDALVDLIKAGTYNTTPKVIQVGDPQRLAAVDKLDIYLPAIFVKPEQTQYVPADMSGTQFKVADVYRILYAFSVQGIAADSYGDGFAELDNAGDALSQDAHLSAIADSIRPHQIEQVGPADADPNPEEDEFLLERGIPVKVMMLRWTVQWLARRSS